MTPDELREKVGHLFRTMYAFEADRRYAADAAIALIRAEVLEEAARVADAASIPMCEGSADLIAAAIRALKEKSE